MIEFRVALGVWLREELHTLVYQSAIQTFSEDTSAYCAHICTTGAAYHSGIMIGTLPLFN